MSESLLVYIGGTPGCATMHIAAFLHLHKEVFCFNSASGAIDGLRERHQDGKVPLATAQTEEASHWKEFLNAKNKETSTEDVFRKRILAVRDDEATRAFEQMKKKERKASKSGTDGRFDHRRSVLVYPVRRNLEELYWTWNKGIHAQNEGIHSRLNEFKVRISKAYTFVEKLMREHNGDVLVVNLCDPDNREEEYEKLLAFLGLEMSDKQQEWVSEEPRTNTFGEKIRSEVAALKRLDFYKEHIA